MIAAFLAGFAGGSDPPAAARRAPTWPSTRSSGPSWSWSWAASARLSGAFIAAFLIGVAEALGILWVPQASLAIVFAVLVVVLAVRPQGLCGAGRPDVAELAHEGKVLRGLTDAYRDFVGAAAARRPEVVGGRQARPSGAIGLAMIVFAGLIPALRGRRPTTIIAQRALYLGLLALSVNFLVANVGLDQLRPRDVLGARRLPRRHPVLRRRSRSSATR